MTTKKTWVNGLTLRADDQPKGFSFSPYDAKGTVKQNGASNWLHVPLPYTEGQSLEQVEINVGLKKGTTIDLIHLRGARQDGLQAYPNPKLENGHWSAKIPKSFKAGPLDLVVHVLFGDPGEITIYGVAITTT